MNCVQSNDLMFDFVYGLLDEPEATALREHATGCAACTAELEKATADQHKLGRAALAITDLAPFQIPNERVAAETTPLPALAPASETTGPSRRGIRPITMIAWAGTLACCAFVAVFTAYNHREQLNEHEGRVVNLSRQQNAIDVRLASLDSKFALEQKQLPKTVNKDAVQLHVAGPGQVTPGVSAGYQVAIRDLDGIARAGKVEVDFLDGKNQSVAKRSFDLSDQTEIPVPAELAKFPGAARMRFVAKMGDKTVGAVEETVVSQSSSLAAHLAVNKILYKPGDRVQMRALVLDRVTLKPAALGTKVGVSLLDDNGKPAAPSIDLLTLGGMAAGEMVLRPDLPEGVYTLEARGDNLAPVRRSIEVLPSVAPPVELLAQNNKIENGKPISNYLQFSNRDGTPAANMPVSGNAVIVDQKPDTNMRSNVNNFARGQNTRAGYNANGMTDAEGKFELVIPGIKDAETGKQQLNIDLVYGAGQKEKAQVTRELLIQPSRVAIEFYPEGGQLIAGMENRVFYRVRAPEGDAAASARFAVHSSKAPLFDSNTETSVGSFLVTPDSKETYTVKIASPKQDDVRNPFAAHAVRNEGLMLRGKTVQTANEPIRLTLENRGPERLVQVIAMCRGQVVAHARLPVNAPITPLDIATDVDGVIRVTAFEVKDGQLVPLTERLFLRPARHRLDVAVEAQADKRSPKAPVLLNIKGLDERQKPQPFWCLASVVDDRFRGDVPEASLSSHFLLLGDAPTDIDLAELPILSLDEPTNPKDLELALGLFGWRRISAAATNPAQMAKAQFADAPKDAGQVAATGASFFYRVEPSVFELRQKLDQQWQISQLALIDAARKQQGELAQERTDVSRLLATARIELEDLTRLPRQRLMAGLGLLALVLLAAGALGMVYGLTRLARRLPATGSFGTACGCLAACIALLIFQPQDGPHDAAPGPLAQAKPPELKDFPAKGRFRMAIEQADALPQANAKVALESNPRFLREAAVKIAAPFNMAAQGDAPEQQRPIARRVADGVPMGEQIARADQTKVALLRTLNEAEMKRGAPVGGMTKDRNVALVQQPYAAPPGAGGGGGFGAAQAVPQKMQGFAGAAPAAPNPARPSIAAAPADADAANTKVEATPKGIKPNPTAPAPRPPSTALGPATKADDAFRPEELPLDILAKKHFAEQRDKNQQRFEVGAYTRQFVARRTNDLSDPATILWSPAVSVPAAGISVPLDVPPGVARFRVHIFGHTEDGRLGVYDGILNTK